MHLCMYVFIYVSKATGALPDSVNIEQIVCDHTVLSYLLPIKNFLRDVTESALYSIKRHIFGQQSSISLVCFAPCALPIQSFLRNVIKNAIHSCKRAMFCQQSSISLMCFSIVSILFFPQVLHDNLSLSISLCTPPTPLSCARLLANLLSRAHVHSTAFVWASLAHILSFSISLLLSYMFSPSPQEY